MHLYIGHKRYSSWSLRPWLAMTVSGIPFTETVLPYAHDDSLINFAAQHRIPATVPVLQHNNQIVWDSLAIMEYLAEQYPEKNLWPSDPSLRAQARSASAEMHSAFNALRGEHPCNFHRVHAMNPSPAVTADLQRLATLWQQFEKATTASSEGEFLCGEFSIVDAMYAPVAWRVQGYQLEVSERFSRWSHALMALPGMTQWIKQGAQEPWRVEATECIGL